MLLLKLKYTKEIINWQMRRKSVRLKRILKNNRKLIIQKRNYRRLTIKMKFNKKNQKKGRMIGILNYLKQRRLVEEKGKENL